MDAVRTERVTVNLTPEQAEELDRFAERNRWTRSTAAAILIERGLAGDGAS
jgi:metal-responsive CopG/Arc/MetJ family transcriptional regulator